MRIGVSHKINREVVLVLGWGRAILLQLAHPLVAQGVAEHSTFSSIPGGRVRRLRYTLEAMLGLTFGSPQEVERVAGTINSIHDRVHGELKEGTDTLPEGTPYSAHDPRLLTWVHATLLDSFMQTYELYVGRLTLQEKDQYCAEATVVEKLLGIPEGYVPRTQEELCRYMKGMFRSSEIVVTDTARRLARELVDPPAGLWIRPLLWFLHLPTRGLLPPPIREAYGLSWSRWEEVLLRLSARVMRILLPFMPRLVRHWPRAAKFWFPVLKAAERLV